MCKLIEHHIKYKEIHGVDETVWLTVSEHTKLHMRLRKQGKCKISPKKLNKISTSAHRRTEKCRQRISNYKHENIKTLHFCCSVMPNVSLDEWITYNESCGTPHYFSRFHILHGINIPIIMEE